MKKIIKYVHELGRALWRPTLAFTIAGILFVNYIYLPLFLNKEPFELPGPFWYLATFYSILYAGFRTAEKVMQRWPFGPATPPQEEEPQDYYKYMDRNYEKL